MKCVNFLFVISPLALALSAAACMMRRAHERDDVEALEAAHRRTGPELTNVSREPLYAVADIDGDYQVSTRTH